MRQSHVVNVRRLVTLWTLSQHWMGPVLQFPAAMVVVVAGAVTVTVVVVAGVVVGEPQRFSAGAGVATARVVRARSEMVEMRENMFESSERKVCCWCWDCRNQAVRGLYLYARHT